VPEGLTRRSGGLGLQPICQSGRLSVFAITAFLSLNSVMTSSSATAANPLAAIQNRHQSLQSSNFVVALNDAYADGSGITCRSEGTHEYSAAAYSLLMDFLAYDRGPGGMSGSEMQAKVQRLVR
jgi:hypothetical protein